MTDDRQLEAMLRDGMAAQARPVVADAGLTERIISTAVREPAPPEPRLWQNWVVPAVAAVLVALLVGSVLFGTKLLHSSSAPPATHPTPTPSLTMPVSPPPSAARSSSAPSGPGSSAPGSQPATSTPVGGPVPTGFSAYDLTWISADDGWALGTAPCSNAPCTSIVRTTDGGQSWIGMPAPRAYLNQTDSINCASSCTNVVDRIRFASAEVGYVFGMDALYLTTDGGETWNRQNGGAYGLEVVGTKVLRVLQKPTCGFGCGFVVQSADVGSSQWQDVPLPSGGKAMAADLAASGTTVVVATYANPAGGAMSATAGLFASTDSGASWRSIGEPCPKLNGQEADTRAVTVGADQSIQVLCAQRAGIKDAAHVVMTSTDGGAHFERSAALPAFGTGTISVGTLSAPAAASPIVGADKLYRWDGSSWQTVAGPTGIRFIGFESPTIGRVLADNGAWMTTDGGLHWSPLSY